MRWALALCLLVACSGGSSATLVDAGPADAGPADAGAADARRADAAPLCAPASLACGALTCGPDELCLTDWPGACPPPDAGCGPTLSCQPLPAGCHSCDCVTTPVCRFPLLQSCNCGSAGGLWASCNRP
jgi:hypothetical protein